MKSTSKRNHLEVLFPRVRAELLRELFFDPTRERYVRELARSTDLALRTIQQELAALEKADLVTSRRTVRGRPHFFRANFQHVAFAPLQQLVIREALHQPARKKPKTPRQAWRASPIRRERPGRRSISAYVPLLERPF